MTPPQMTYQHARLLEELHWAETTLPRRKLLREMIQALGQLDGPDVSDGTDAEGFPGGDARIGPRHVHVSGICAPGCPACAAEDSRENLDPAKGPVIQDGVALQSVAHPLNPASLEKVEIEVDRAPGLKLDEGKPPAYWGVVDYFANALLAVAAQSKRGDEAPGHVRGGWETVPEGHQRYSDAFARHLLEEANVRRDGVRLGGPQEPHADWRERMIQAMATTVWNDLARLEHFIRNAGIME